MGKKKFFSAVLCAALVLALLPCTALAATATSVIVGGQTLDGTTGKTYATTDGNGVVTPQLGYTESDPWNIKFQNGVLTLKDAKIAGVNAGYDSSFIEKNYAIYAAGELRLVLEGSNEAYSTYNATPCASAGIWVRYLGDTNNASLTIEGGGSLNAYASDNGKDHQQGIKVSGVLNVKGGTITADGGSTNGNSFGVFTTNEINMTGGTLTATGGNATSMSCGVWSNGSVTISGGTLNATGGTGGINSYGVTAGDGIIINASADGQVNVTAKTADTSGADYRSAFNRSPVISDGAYYTWSLVENSPNPTLSTTTPYTWESRQTFTELKLGKAVATPTFSLAEGTYQSAQDVTLACTTAGATIHYTTDGSDPTETSTPFVAGTPITVAATTTVKAKAFQTGMSASAAASAAYTITPPAVSISPAASFPAGNAGENRTVTISCDVANFNATNNFDSASLGTHDLRLGTINGAGGADGSIRDGSIIITLNAAYLNTLQPGGYPLTVRLRGGYDPVTTEIVVTAAPAAVPKTGDNTPLLLLCGLLLLSGTGLLVSRTVWKRKEER